MHEMSKLSPGAQRRIASAHGGLATEITRLCRIGMERGEFREFDADDATFSAGLTGFMRWFEADGDELLDQRADLDNAGAFSLEPLVMDDIEELPLPDDGRDPQEPDQVQTPKTFEIDDARVIDYSSG